VTLNRNNRPFPASDIIRHFQEGNAESQPGLQEDCPKAQATLQGKFQEYRLIQNLK
jgi:hypothetical protein